MTELRKAEIIKKKLAEKYVYDTTATYESTPCDLYGENAILHVIENDDLDNALKMLRQAADWFVHHHPTGTNKRGECDFTAIRLTAALYEKECFCKLPDDVKASIKDFYLKNDFSSYHASENHSFMFRVARLLAAQYYKDEYFPVYKRSASELYKMDTEYVSEFIDYRAGRGWGEFDSLGYVAEVLLILITLYNYTDNVVLKRKAAMMADVIFLDMIADSKGDIYGGAHGRSYPVHIINRERAFAAGIYRYFFTDAVESTFTNVILSDYKPSPIVYEVIARKSLPYENRERKLLHCCSAWASEEIKHDVLERVSGSICKYTYLCEDYILGSVNKQDRYPEGEEDGWYAHHQQHEWELTLGGRQNVIFTHHYSAQGAHCINNRFTGDCGCCCGSFYTNKNTALAMYNIEDPEKEQRINAYVNLPLFENRILDGSYLFLEYENIYISLYFSNGYTVTAGGEFKDRELMSYGSQHAVALRIERREKFESLTKFAESIKNIPVIFDKTAKTVKFDGIELRKDGNSECGRENVYPYAKLYDCPFMQSEWDSKMIEIKTGNKTVVYDFNENKITEKQ